MSEPEIVEDVEAIPAGWMGIDACAAMHGVAKPTIEQWIRLKRVPTKLVRLPPGSGRGPRVRRIVEVAHVTLALAKTRGRARLENAPHGKIASRAFSMLDAGASVRELVVKLSITAGVALEHAKRWRELGAAPLEIGLVAKARLESIVGPFATVEELVRNVAALVERGKGEGH